MNIQGWMNVAQVMGGVVDVVSLSPKYGILLMQRIKNSVNKGIKHWYWSYSQWTHAFAHLNEKAPGSQKRRGDFLGFVIPVHTHSTQG